jgi:hypothetical protein
VVEPQTKPSPPPSFAWVVISPVVGALAGLLGTGIIVGLLGWLFSFQAPPLVGLIGALVGGVAFLAANIVWFRRG